VSTVTSRGGWRRSGCGIATPQRQPGAETNRRPDASFLFSVSTCSDYERERLSANRPGSCEYRCGLEDNKPWNGRRRCPGTHRRTNGR